MSRMNFWTAGKCFKINSEQQFWGSIAVAANEKGAQDEWKF